jgi:hypothetical protein
MAVMNSTLRLLLMFASLVVVFQGVVVAQPGGGKTSDSSSKPVTKPSSTTPARPAATTPKTTTSTKPRSTSGPAASIDGKWWTSGNDFGASEVVLTQNGSSVTGQITFTDGGTGTINGSMTGKRLQFNLSKSNGENGTGWLELSWNNFLGGPWRSPKVRDGSWTMMRIEGKWCFGGSRNRIRTVTHNSRGEVLSIAEDGTQSTGRLEGPWLYLTSDDGMTIKGEMDFRSNRMNWSTGFFWSWCGRQ